MNREKKKSPSPCFGEYAITGPENRGSMSITVCQQVATAIWKADKTDSVSL